MNLEETCRKTIEIVKEAGAYIREQYDSREERNIEKKGEHNFVTHVDKTAEKMLVDALGKLLPEAGFIAEEGTSQTKGEKYNWIIDPLDGTTNFIHGAYPFAVSVALAENSIPVVGVILEIGLNECFYAWRSGGAWLDGDKIQTSNKRSLNDALIATGFPYTDFNKLPQFMESMDWFMKHSHGLRRLGSAATDIAWVACGRYDGFYEYGLNPWDIAAGLIILEEAGGRSCDFQGGSDCLFGANLICSNGPNYDEFVALIGNIMGK